MTESDTHVTPDDHEELAQRLSRIYSDQWVTTLEFQQLRDDADALFMALAKRFVPRPEDPVDQTNQLLLDVQLRADEVVKAMKTMVLSIKKARPQPADKILVKQALGYQVAYIKACLDRVTQTL
ncbi:hypothetical protein [Pseudomonas ovata]|uniref:hypothetical protein n=1 Tax=Pseudomonas ovata TaxID=1839709 RepID=UPI001874C3C2|nr:hypothetical protein [Pseudomonas ovata]